MCRLKFVTFFTAMLETRGRRRWSADDSWLSYVKGNYPNLVFACCVSSRNIAIRGSGQARLLTEETGQYYKKKTLCLFDGEPNLVKRYLKWLNLPQGSACHNGDVKIS